MLTIAPTDNFAAKQDAGTDILFSINGMLITDATGLPSARTAQGALSTTAAALLTSPSSGTSLSLDNIKMTNVGTLLRIVTCYKDSAGTTYDATTQWGSPIVLQAGESAEWNGSWNVYDANGVPKFASAVWPKIVEGTEPSTPAAGFLQPWANTLHKMLLKDSTGLNWVASEDARNVNYIINGEFDYAQRQVPGTLTTYSNTTGRSYAPDRFGITNENASCQYQQIDTQAAVEANCATRYYGKFSKITTTGKMVISQVIESGNCFHLRSRQVRVQLKMKASAAKTIRVALLQLQAAGTVDAPPATFISAFGANATDPTWGTNLAKITAPTNPDNCTVATDGLTCSVTTAWQRFGGVFTCPSDFKNLILVVFTDSQFAAADTLSITEVGVYDGAEIREWSPRPQAEQMDNVHRFYFKTFTLPTAPAQNAGLTGAWRGNAAQAGAVSFVHGAIQFPVRMFKAPTVTFYNPAAANAFLRQLVTPSDATATSATQVTDRVTEITATGLAAWALGHGIAIHATADAEI